MSKAAELAALIGSQTALSNRNLIINGAMQVAQRGTSFTSPSSGSYTLDRWRLGYSGEQVALDISQASDAPAGLKTSYKITLTTPESSLTTTNQINVSTRLEGQNLHSLKKGTSSAESATISFYVKSAVTGTYSLELYDGDNSRQYVTTYSVSSANTWEQKRITIPGDTIGAFDNDANASLYIAWWVDAGPSFTTGTTTDAWQEYDSDGRAVSTNKAAFMTTTNATWQITGVQLEVGENASDFEHRSFGEELALCHRYAYSIQAQNNPLGLSGATISGGSRGFFGFGSAHNSANPVTWLNMPVPMRAVPSLTKSDNTHFFFDRGWAAGAASTSTTIQTLRSSSKAVAIILTVSTTLSNGDAGSLSSSNDSSYMIFDAEL